MKVIFYSILFYHYEYYSDSKNISLFLSFQEVSGDDVTSVPASRDAPRNEINHRYFEFD